MSDTYQGLHARHYDVIYAGKSYDREAVFVHDLIDRVPGRLLDVACGSGRHAVEFARLGWQVTGVDHSPPLLDLARQNAARAAAEITFVESDMRELDAVGGPFDAVTCLFDSIGYLRTNEGIVAGLSAMRRVLAPGGRIVVEFLHGPAILLHSDPVRVGRWDLPEGGELMRIAATEIDAVALTMRVSYDVLELYPDGRYSRDAESHVNRSLGLEEMRSMMTLAGLRADRFAAAYAERDAPIRSNTFHILALAEAL